MSGSTFTAPTRDASLLTAGTLADARLSSNVPLKDAANVFTENQRINGDITAGAGTGLGPYLRGVESGGNSGKIGFGDATGWYFQIGSALFYDNGRTAFSGNVEFAGVSFLESSPNKFITHGDDGNWGLHFRAKSTAAATLILTGNGGTNDPGRVLVGNPSDDGSSSLQVEGVVAPKSYTVGTLPTAGTARRIAFASDGRKAGEGAAAGTGVMVFDDGTNWIAVDTGATVAA